jgi:adenylate cyclase
MQVKLHESRKSSHPFFNAPRWIDSACGFRPGTKYFHGHNIEDTRVGGRIAQEAMAMCPENPYSYFHMAYFHWMEYWLGPEQSRQASIEKGMEMAKKAIAMDDSIPNAHAFLGMFHSLKREYDEAIAEGEKALALGPGVASVNQNLAMSLMWAGRPEEAIPLYQKALRLDPVGATGLYLNFGHALRVAGRFDEAVSAYRKSLQREPNNVFAHISLAITYILMGQESEARAEAAEVLRINPGFSVDSWARSIAYKEQSEKDKAVAALRKTGLK